MIVKLKLPVKEDEYDQGALIYNESRDWKCVVPVTPKIVEIMKGRRIAYFDVDSDRWGGITFNSEASKQDW